MENITRYVQETLGIDLNPHHVDRTELGRLALFIREAYIFFYADLYHVPVVLAVLDEQNEFSSGQIIKHLDLISNSLHHKVILVTGNMPGISRRKFIERRINFIVPGKQLFLPEFLVDLADNLHEQKRRDHKNTLLPSAQLMVLHYLLYHRTPGVITDLSFKEIADKFDYTPMAITKAVENLLDHNLCQVRGSKEKRIYFQQSGQDLWHKALPYLTSPVLRQVYVDELPPLPLVKSSISALSHYSDINPSMQETYAIEKTVYYGFKKISQLVRENEFEGIYSLEIWKYDPFKLNEIASADNYADPLSIYLSLQKLHDERVEMALEQIVSTYIYG